MIVNINPKQAKELYRIDEYIARWGLVPDGEHLATHSSILQPVVYKGVQAVLKIALAEDEKQGAKLMEWWDGVGAAPVLRYDDDALLMERITSDRPNLIQIVAAGDDDKATRIICSTASLLHGGGRGKPLPPLMSFRDWFAPLLSHNVQGDSTLERCATITRYLVDNQEDMCVLHGDLHHENILYSDKYGWVAIDPKSLYGERAFDYANILCNPTEEVALSEGRLSHQVDVICEAAMLDRTRMLQWVVAWGGLSACWLIEEKLDPSLSINVAKIALKELKR